MVNEKQCKKIIEEQFPGCTAVNCEIEGDFWTCGIMNKESGMLESFSAVCRVNRYTGDVSFKPMMEYLDEKYGNLKAGD